MSVDFEFSYMVNNNLGGQGPDTGRPESIRFANVGSMYHPGVGTARFDLELTATTPYTPQNTRANGFILKKFASVNLRCGHSVGLRVALRRSCATMQSCRVCKESGFSRRERNQCYAAGCSCVGTTVFASNQCRDTDIAANSASYNCSQSNEMLVLPRAALTSLTVFDIDTSSDGEYIERITVPDYDLSLIHI